MVDYNKLVLPNGVAVITENIPHALSTIIGFYITTGSRDEKGNTSGICHFIEHTVFKGTENRSERDISTVIESKGGILNASTSREWTSFYAHILPKQLPLAIDVLSDLIKNPLFKKKSIEMERFVIKEEIKGFYDSPENLLFLNALFSTFGNTHPLSSPILGSIESIDKITDNDIRNFWKDNYTTDRIYVSAVGRVNHEEICDSVMRNLGNRKGKKFIRNSSPISGMYKNVVFKPELNHEYVALSSKSFPYNNEVRFPFLVGLSILGMGMSSRLFQKLRQEKGLVYNVSAFSEFFSDTGIFGIYFSTDKNKLDKTLDTIKKLLNNLSFSSEEIEEAKERIKGNIVISLEDNVNRMSRNIKEDMYLGRRISVDELLERISRVKYEDVQEIQHQFMKPEIFDITVIGSSKDVSW